MPAQAPGSGIQEDVSIVGGACGLAIQLRRKHGKNVCTQRLCAVHQYHIDWLRQSLGWVWSASQARMSTRSASLPVAGLLVAVNLLSREFGTPL